VIDLHSHVLPGVDDGPTRLAGSLALARAAVAAGTRVMAATPHIGARYPVAPCDVAGHVARLQAELELGKIPLEVVGGGELAPSRAADLPQDDLRCIALGGGCCILLECPFVPVSGLMPRLVAHLHERGFRVLLGHPERSPGFLRDPASLVALVGSGAYVQITAPALRGDFGTTARRYCFELLAAGLVHAVASDAHDARRRPPSVKPIVEETVRGLGLPAAMITFVTEAAPRALLADEPVPPSPA